MPLWRSSEARTGSGNVRDSSLSCCGVPLKLVQAYLCYLCPKYAKPEWFQVNQVVQKDFTRKKTKGSKLKECYVGPYTITKVLPHVTYELADPSDESKTFMQQGPTLSCTPHLHLLMRRMPQGKKFQKQSAQRSKMRLSPFYPIPKMKFWEQGVSLAP